MSSSLIKIQWDNDVLLNELNNNHMKFVSSNMNNYGGYSNCLKWSPDNQLVTINLMEKIIVLELNIHRVYERFPFVIQSNNDDDSLVHNIQLRSSQIKPNQNDFKMTNNKSNHHENIHVCLQPPKSQEQFVDFEFCPIATDDAGYLLACLTDQNILTVHLNTVPGEWPAIFNVSKWLNEQCQQSPIHCKNSNYDEYFSKLNQFRISAFAWSCCQIKSTDTKYRLYLGTRSGYLWLTELVFNKTSNYECNMNLIKKVVLNDLNDEAIVTAKTINYDQVLLVQYNDGRLLMLDGQLFKKGVWLWNDIDYSPCYNIAVSNKQDGSIEIVLSKYQFILVLIIDTENLCLKHCKQITIDHLNIEDIFAVYNLNNYYCMSTMNGQLYAFKWIHDDYDQMCIRKLILASHKQNDDVYFASVASSSNQALISFISKQCRFSGRLTNFKSENVIFYLATLMDTNTNAVILRKRLLQQPTLSSNQLLLLSDMLYLFRCNCLSKKQLTNETLKQMLKLLLVDVPVWLVKNYGQLERLKCIRYLARYCLIERTHISQISHNERDLLQCLIAKLNVLIMKNYFSKILQKSIIRKNQDVEQWKMKLKREHLFSLNNLIKCNILTSDFIPQKSIKFISNLNDQQVIDTFESINHQDVNYSNACPICEAHIPNPGAYYFNNSTIRHCPNGHAIDVDANSLMVLNPSVHTIQLCCKCYHSKILIINKSESLWTSNNGSCCLFCL